MKALVNILVLASAAAHVWAQAASQYNITVVNLSGFQSGFSVALQPPDVSGASGEVYTTVWQSFLLAANGRASALTTTDWYAWAGETSEYPAPGVRITGGVSLLAQLGGAGANGSTFEMGLADETPTLTEVSSQATGRAYEIITGGDLPNPNEKYLLGLGKSSEVAIGLPAAVMFAQNMESVMIAPAMRFFVDAFEYPVGEILDLTAGYANAANVDFTRGDGQGKNVAVVTYTQTGTWLVKYQLNLEE